MRLVRGETDLQDLITVEVDPSAEPADWDQALAVFLLKFVRNQATKSAGTAAAPVDLQSAADKKELCK